MKRMRPLAKAMQEWLRRAPRWTALLLGVLIVADTAHIVLRVRSDSRLAADPRSGAPRPGTSPPARRDARGIVAAHLFGVVPADARPGAAGAARSALHLALSGVIATSDPNDGYAMLGEQGQATRLYRTGAALANAGSATLYEVFADHVVLDFGGRQETLSLPRQHLNTSGGLRVARFDAPTDTDAIALPISAREEPPSAAESWFSNLDAERYTTNGKTGLRLHPAMRFQRRYGLREGDSLIAVNGVPVGDADAIDNLLRSGGKTVALTLTRNGVEETVTFPVEE
jgi:type II secretion system protein C